MGETVNGNTNTSETGGFTNLSQAKYDSTRFAEVSTWNAFVASLPASRQAQAGPPPIRPQSTNVYANPGAAVEAPNAEVPLAITKNTDGSTATAFGTAAGITFNLPARTA